MKVEVRRVLPLDVQVSQLLDAYRVIGKEELTIYTYRLAKCISIHTVVPSAHQWPPNTVLQL